MRYIHDLRDNYSQINMFSLAVFYVFLILWIIVFLACTFKMYYNRNINEYYDSVYYFLLGKSKNIFEDVMRLETQNQFNDLIEQKESKIQNIRQQQDANQRFYEEKIEKARKSISVVEKNNEELIDDLDKMNDYLINVQNYIHEKNEINQNNIEKISEMLKSRLKTFVLGMFQTLKVLKVCLLQFQ